MSRIIHIVLFQFKEDTQTQTVSNICDEMMALQQKCVRPESGETYIKMSLGGKDNSPEGQQHGLTHGFVMEFESEADRQYYLTADPAHLAFVKKVGTVAKSATVLDFTPGKF